MGSLRLDHDAAAASVRYNGFYLFQLINASDLQLCVDQAGVKGAVNEVTARSKERYQETPMVSWRLLAEIDQSGDRQLSQARVSENVGTSV
jgi:hypothetical protein